MCEAQICRAPRPEADLNRGGSQFFPSIMPYGSQAVESVFGSAGTCLGQRASYLADKAGGTMRRLRFMGVVVTSLLAIALGSASTSADASAAVTTPGAPTGVHATAIAGLRGATVSWGAPVSDGGSPILYYIATNYNGSDFCISMSSGSGTCHIDNLKVGTVRPSIRVRAVSAHGRGAVATTLAVVTQENPSNGNASPSAPSGTNSAAAGSSPAGVSQSTPTATSGFTGASNSSSVSSAGDPAELPFTGANLEAQFILGVSLVLGALLILSPLGRRRRTRGNTADRLLQP